MSNFAGINGTEKDVTKTSETIRARGHIDIKKLETTV